MVLNFFYRRRQQPLHCYRCFEFCSIWRSGHPGSGSRFFVVHPIYRLVQPGQQCVLGYINLHWQRGPKRQSLQHVCSCCSTILEDNSDHQSRIDKCLPPSRPHVFQNINISSLYRLSTNQSYECTSTDKIVRSSSAVFIFDRSLAANSLVGALHHSCIRLAVFAFQCAR